MNTNAFPFGGTGSDGGPTLGSLFGGANGPASAIFEAMDQLRKSFEQRPSGGSRMARGDVRSAVLSLLAEQPMHGYQIINEIAERSGGSWKPSAGSVYPTLQLLADEGLLTADEQNGRKTYSLTEAGRAVAAESSETPAPWVSSSKGDEGSRDNARFHALPKAGVDLAAAAAQVGRSGSPEQVRQTIEVLDEARRKLYTILAQD
ncbi:PadR family transcriptional regulator [Microbacterium sp. 179-I 3D3 NHS]|uniref:PadR family transcriptional regulator n=1 Tax=Microbacterium sp. 179-I 3D3 NHS TaxID=3142382 RepID=UPI0039A196AF